MCKTLSFLFMGTMMATLAGAAGAQQDFHQTLISVDRNVRIENWEMSASGAGGPKWSIRKSVLHGGRQEGVDLLVVDNGRLSFTLVPTRGMSVLDVVCGDIRLGWNSPVKEVIHPQYINLQSRGGLGWLEGFNEWLVRCGLEFAGAPGPDVFINNKGDQAIMELTLHGKIGNIPASEVEVIVEAAPPHTIRVRGRVDERIFFGPKLELWTEISTVPGSREFQVSDRVTNRSAAEQEFQLIYHINYGPPFLEKGSRFVTASRQVTPINERAAAAVDTYDSYLGPTPGYIEEVYCMRPYADSQGQTMVMLRNAKGDLGTSISYALEQLPYFTLWKNTLTEADGYVTGLEPATGFPNNRKIERKYGRLPKLAGGEGRNFVLNFAIQTDAREVSAALERIKAIQGGRATQVDRSPLEVK
jgi:hypothetical protein